MKKQPSKPISTKPAPVTKKVSSPSKKTASPTAKKTSTTSQPAHKPAVQLKSTVTGKATTKPKDSKGEDKTCFKSKEDPKNLIVENNFKCAKTLTAHTDSVECIIAIDDSRIVSCGYDGVIKLWDIHDINALQKPTMTFTGHSDSVFKVIKFTTFKIISCSRDKTIRIWNIETGKELACITGKEPYYVVKQISDAQVAAAGGDFDIRVFNLMNEEETKEDFILSGQTNVIRDLEVFDGNIICSGGECKTILIWNFVKKTHLGTLEGHKAGVICLLRLKNGQLASGSNDMTIRIWDIKKKICVSILEGGTDKIMSLGELPNGNIVSGGSEWNLVVWGGDKKIQKEVEGHEGSVNAILVLPYGLVITGSADNTMKFWK